MTGDDILGADKPTLETFPDEPEVAEVGHDDDARDDVGTVDADEGTCSGCLSFSVFITGTDGSETITSFASPVVSDDVATVVIIADSDCFSDRVSFAVEGARF